MTARKARAREGKRITLTMTVREMNKHNPRVGLIC